MDKEKNLVSVEVVESKDNQVDLVKDEQGNTINRFAGALEQSTTTKWEMVGYALYYFANNSSGPYAYTPTAFQNLLNQAGYDKALGPGTPCTDSTSHCYISFGTNRSIDSVVLINQGIGFTMQTLIFLWLGGFADYGNSGTFVLLGLSVLTWGVQFGFLGVHDGSKYKTAFALSVLSSFGYQGCQSFWTADFPVLARNLPKSKALETLLINGDITEEQYNETDEYYRNKITNYCWAISNVGMMIVYSVSIGILFAIDSRSSDSQNNWGISLCITWANVFFIVFGVPWFFLKKKRAARKLPPGTNYFLLPFKQIAYAFKSFKILKQTAIYLFAYWLLGDALNTSINLQLILSNEVISYDMISVQYINLLQAGTGVIGMGLFWWVQKHFKFETKTMFLINSGFIIFLPLYGLIGTWTDKIGFHNVWEVYAYNAYFGLFISPYYAYSSTMMSCVCPRGKEYLFFAIFSTINKTSSFIGPFVTSGIVDRTGNTNTGFSFTLALGIVAFAATWFINEKQSRIECEEFLVEEDKKIEQIL